MKTKLITSDIIKLVKSALKEKPEVKKYNLDRFNRFAIGNYVVTMIKGEKPVINIGDNQSTEYYKVWREDIGGVLLKELSKEDPELYEIKTSSFKVLLKRIAEGEYLDFVNKKMDHIMIGNFGYTIIKAVNPKKTYGDKVDDYDIEPEDEEVKPKPVSSDPDPEEILDNEPITANSYALF